MTADVSQGDITSPDPAMRAFATEDLLDASPGRPGGETHAYSLEEEVQMLGALPEPAALAVAVFTGACKGEICGLLWEGYDGFSIRVKQAVWRSHVDEPKQEKS